MARFLDLAKRIFSRADINLRWVRESNEHTR